MKRLNENETRTANGGARQYGCPFCHRFTGSYWRTYYHALSCSYFNSKVFRIGWTAAYALLTAGLRF